ncbi:hypothetical protein [Sphingomonas montana]|uniref:hypothetical protein n=1 Tax=Sphingomonas montana TaxID=1843236 RepID=UPI00096D0992|nr:hypothetical protein [Sphingomonas montana]
MKRAILSLLAALAAAPAVAQTASTTPVTPVTATPADTDNAVVVQGMTRRSLNDVVSAMIQPEPGVPIAKFRDWLCVAVQGLRPEFKQILENRIRQVAQDARIRVRTQGCQPNLLVVAPPDPDGFADKLTRDHPMLFGDPAIGVAPQSLITALRKPRPVRWFAATYIQTTASLGSSSMLATPTVSLVSMWRLKAPTRADKLLNVVILDMDKLNGLSWKQLGDYIALVFFTSPKMDATFPSGTTLLSLFADRDAGRPLLPERTRLDRSLLAATYGVDENLSAPLQRTRIIDDVVKQRVVLPADPTAAGEN